jgi:hypothetical protein
MKVGATSLRPELIVDSRPDYIRAGTDGFRNARDNVEQDAAAEIDM